MTNTRKGDRIISKATSSRFGHVKGDTLMVENVTETGVSAENLTRPEMSWATLLHEEYKNISLEERTASIKEPSEKHRVYFLGIPLFTIRKVDDNASE